VEFFPKNVRLEGGWAFFVKGSFAKNAPGAPSQKIPMFFYIQTSLAF